MKLRALLFVPGDRPERFAKAAASGADAVILDLEDSIAPEKKASARLAVGDFLRQPRTVRVFVRVNPLGAQTDDDLAAILPGGPDGIVLPKAQDASSITALAGRMKADIPILPIASETPKAVFGLGSYGEVASRLCGLTWGAEDLPAAIGASTSRREDGGYTAPYEMVRALTLFGAHAAGVAAIETVYPDIADEPGLKAYALRGRRDGFSGMMAIHPAQVPVILAAFTPGEAERERARRIVAAFAAQPGAGVIRLDGQMLDAPHLKQAQQLLAE